MAAESPNSFIDALLPYVRNRPADAASRVHILNMANDHMCSVAFWRWLASSEPEITLDGSQEYTWTPASPILRVSHIYMTTDKERFTILTPAGMSPDTDRAQGIPSLFSYEESSGDAVIRLWPKPPATFSGKIVPIAKLAHTRITAGNYESADILPHPSSLNHIFSLFVLHYLYLRSQVGPQGEVVHQQGPPTIRGTLAQAMAAVEAVRFQDALQYDSVGSPMNA